MYVLNDYKLEGYNSDSPGDYITMLTMGRAKLKTHLTLLKYLAHGKPGAVRALMLDSSPDLVLILCECAYESLK